MKPAAIGRIARLTFVILAAVLFTACASIHPGIYAVPLDRQGAELDRRETPLGLVISCKKDPIYSDDHFTFLHVTLENRSADWIRIREAYVDFGDQAFNQKIRITSGQDIAAWHESTEQRIRVEEFNRGAFLAVLGTIGAIASASDNDGLAALGALTYLGASTSLTALDIQHNIRRIESTRIFPENHLLYGDIDIPPGGFVKRFILFQVADPQMARAFRQFYLTYQTESGRAETVRMAFVKKRRPLKRGLIN